ncbi:hypothetical protein WOLCODRAFT_148638 [Wolfiporia cocos MD-104 SS10]|uniref:Uncharacterized protein n=1 Tax=Wolfiporia cocos (strain MD-104) TaxID=742152 RepID=A0A2H3J608_WOLCO|nr:hypothetical protein WOLCODRAFT_148638 [Wolfiporia cocos MD-104 SS10]
MLRCRAEPSRIFAPSVLRPFKSDPLASQEKTLVIGLGNGHARGRCRLARLGSQRATPGTPGPWTAPCRLREPANGAHSAIVDPAASTVPCTFGMST